MIQPKNYNANNIKVSDIVYPITGFYKYVKRNVKQKTTDTNDYANAFWHLLLIHTSEIMALSCLGKSLNSLLK